MQRDRIEVSIWAWGHGKACWLVEHRVLPGEPGQPQVWQALSALLDESWRHACGAELKLEGLGIDSGFATQEVYGWVRTQPAGPGVRAQGGRARLGPGRPADRGRRLARRQAAAARRRVRTVATGLAKLELFNHLRLPVPLDGAR